jgi:hypothetical protein
MSQPDNGRTPRNKKTIVKVIYDNDAIYIAALLYDDEPDKIRKEISQRDSFAYQTFGVFINGFDGQQDFQFLSTLLRTIRLHNDRYQRRGLFLDAIYEKQSSQYTLGG